ncbi:MAG: hypothetical protein ABIR27_04630, partial [Dokdonella sp.]
MLKNNDLTKHFQIEIGLGNGCQGVGKGVVSKSHATRRFLGTRMGYCLAHEFSTEDRSSSAIGTSQPVCTVECLAVALDR